jgi:hypothetical protein
MKDFNCAECKNAMCEPLDEPCFGCDERYCNFSPSDNFIKYIEEVEEE